ncbi:hypothetical protein SteCoe_14232 [Stentor coeruleus]|uniref:C2H2-type domain-containing protein n=1 Tax=Stentor coeruleus TaxID=5963 RepID=A0A1R2C6K5_9CILI|nr:hypothetical protein SteCoe_14232 [Stentor coeruleus]
MNAIGEYKVSLFCCMMNNCNKTYSTKFNLKRHVEICHLKQKKHKCDYCNKYFVSQQNLREHVFIHTGAKPYECSYCGEHFRQISQLSLHKRNHEFMGKPKGFCLDAIALGTKSMSLTQLLIQNIRENNFYNE